MKPDVTRVLGGVAMSVATDLLPEVRTPIGQQTGGLAFGLLTMVAQEFDRAAARLVEEARAMVAIFEASRAVTLPGDLRARLDSATAGPLSADLHIPALQAENDYLRGLLIELHAAVESLDGPAARKLEEAIWDELRESTRRRHLENPRA